jgi:hypothetical protein
MTQCPVCKQTLHRTPRKPIERAMSYVIPVQRYICYNHACRWNGLRVTLEAHPLLGTNRNSQGSSS